MLSRHEVNPASYHFPFHSLRTHSLQLATTNGNMNNILTIGETHESERSSAAYEFRVRGLNGVRTSAIVWPTSLTPARVCGVVEWQDPMCMSSIVSTEGDSSAWIQRIFLVWAAAGPNSIRYVPELAAGHWASLRVSFPDADGETGNPNRFSLSRSKWRAVFSSSNPAFLNKYLLIPMELRHLDVGSLFLEMAWRLALHSSPSAERRHSN